VSGGGGSREKGDEKGKKGGSHTLTHDQEVCEKLDMRNTFGEKECAITLAARKYGYHQHEGRKKGTFRGGKMWL